MVDHEIQQSVLRSRSRFVVIEAGRRSGKTELAKRVGVMDAVKPHLDRHGYFVAYCAPVRDQAREIYWEDLKALSHPWWSRDPRETDLRIFLKSGSILGVVGMDRPARIEGRPVDFAYVDEMAEMKSGVWDRHLRPALSTVDRLGSAWLYGVPRPGSEFKQVVDLALDPNEPDYEYFHWTSDTITALKDEVEAARRTMDPLIFEQEYMAKRVLWAGRAYHNFTRERNCKALDYWENRPLIVAFDFGHKPGCCVYIQEQHHRVDGSEVSHSAIIGEEFVPRDSNTPMICRKIIQEWGERHKGELVCHGDATGSQKRSSGVIGSDWAIIEKYLEPVFEDRLTIAVEKSNPAVADRLNAVNSRLLSAAGDVRLFVDPSKAKNVVEDFEAVTLLEGTARELDKKSDPMRSHVSDALGYYLHQEFPVEQAGLWVEDHI